MVHFAQPVSAKAQHLVFQSIYLVKTREEVKKYARKEAGQIVTLIAEFCTQVDL